MADLISCSVGVSLDGHCYADNIISNKKIDNFDDAKKKLLTFWCNLEIIHSICNYHEKVYIGRFVSDRGKLWCDPFNRHLIKVRSDCFLYFIIVFYVFPFKITFLYWIKINILM